MGRSSTTCVCRGRRICSPMARHADEVPAPHLEGEAVAQVLGHRRVRHVMDRVGQAARLTHDGDGAVPAARGEQQRPGKERDQGAGEYEPQTPTHPGGQPIDKTPHRTARRVWACQEATAAQLEPTNPRGTQAITTAAKLPPHVVPKTCRTTGHPASLAPASPPVLPALRPAHLSEMSCVRPQGSKNEGMKIMSAPA